MAALLELNRCWRDFRTAPESPRGGYVRALFDEDDASLLARIGLYHLRSLAKHECLVLLGRPGAGKTSEIERIFYGDVQGFADECCVTVSCKEIDADIDRQVDRLPEWRSAVQQSKPVRLAIDGLDEGYLRDAGYFAALKLGLKNLRSQYPNLRLLLACRPAEWDATFGKAIHDLWRGQEEPKAYVLQPLSPLNQRVLVESWGVDDPARMLRWMRLNNFEEFAEWPRSLKWLADEFGTGEAEQITYTDLCKRRAMRSFSEEDKRLEESGSSDQAEYWAHALMLVAATVVSCAKKGVALDGNAPACLTLDEMFQKGSILDMPARPPLTRVTVRRAVRTSDLMEVHDGYHRFQNQSDLEFLAARECSADDIPPLLAKISHWPSLTAHAGETRTLAEALIAKGVAALNREDVRRSLTDFVAARIKEDDWFFHGSDSKSLARIGLDNTEHRRDFLLMLSHHRLDDTLKAHSLEHMPFLPDDYSWLLNELAKAEGHSASVLARLTSSFVWQLGDEHAELIDRTYNASYELRALFPLANDPSFFAQLRQWRLEGEEQRRIQTAEYRSRIERPRYSHDEHLVQALKTCRAGHLEWWTDVCYALSHPSSLNDFTKFVSGTDVRQLPGWQRASDDLRTELTGIAHGFLLQDSTPEPPGRALPEALFG